MCERDAGIRVHAASGESACDLIPATSREQQKSLTHVQVVDPSRHAGDEEQNLSREQRDFSEQSFSND